MASTLALRGVPAARRAEGPASCGARAPRRPPVASVGRRDRGSRMRRGTRPPRRRAPRRARARVRGGPRRGAGRRRRRARRTFRRRHARANATGERGVRRERVRGARQGPKRRRSTLHRRPSFVFVVAHEDAAQGARKIASPTRRGGKTKKNARVFKNASLGKYCTLGLGGNARVVVEVYTIEQLVSTLRLCASLDAPARRRRKRE